MGLGWRASWAMHGCWCMGGGWVVVRLVICDMQSPQPGHHPCKAQLAYQPNPNLTPPNLYVVQLHDMLLLVNLKMKFDAEEKCPQMVRRGYTRMMRLTSRNLVGNHIMKLVNAERKTKIVKDLSKHYVNVLPLSWAGDLCQESQ